MSPQKRTPEIMRDLLAEQVKLLPLPVLKKMERAAYRLYQSTIPYTLKPGTGIDTRTHPELTLLRDHLTAIWSVYWKEEKRRQVLSAEKKDKGVVLFEVFKPRKYVWDHPTGIIRTPNRKIEFSSWTAEPQVEVALPKDWEKDFRKAMEMEEAA